jgi:hypothetical protein
MARPRLRKTILGMSTPMVTEAPLRLEPVTADPFVTDLEHPASDSELRLIAAAAASRRRIFD